LKILEQWGEEKENGPMKREDCMTNVFYFFLFFIFEFCFARASWLVLTTFLGGVGEALGCGRLGSWADGWWRVSTQRVGCGGGGESGRMER
jgi:hypothetical protein